MAKVIVVDDELQTCKYIAQKLIEDGHTVRVSVTGHEAIDLGHLFRPDLVVADWRLGNDYDGIEVAMACQHVNANVKTILVTAYPSEELEAMSKSAPIFALLIKPFSLARLSEVVRDAIGSGGEPFNVANN